MAPRPEFWICPVDDSKWDVDGTPPGYYGDPPECPRCKALLTAPGAEPYREPSRMGMWPGRDDAT